MLKVPKLPELNTDLTDREGLKVNFLHDPFFQKNKDARNKLYDENRDMHAVFPEIP